MQNAIFQWPDEERMTKYAYNCNFSMITHDRTRYEYIRKLQEEEEEAERGSHVRQLTESEKEALIEGLKAKWEKVNTDYQATTHITKLDTIGKAALFFWPPLGRSTRTRFLKFFKKKR